MISRQYTNLAVEEKIFRCRLLSLFLVQDHPGTRNTCNRGWGPCRYHLEQEFHSKLHQPRIRASRRTRYHPKIRIVCCTANRIWRRELRPIKDIEELRSEFQSQPFIAPKPRSLKNGKVKVTDPVGSYPGVNARLVPENEIGRRRKASCAKPFRYPWGGTSGGTTRNHIRPRASPKERGPIHLAVRKYQWEAALKNRHAVRSPPSHDSVHPSLRAREIPSALSKRKVENVADD
jgi:hypothetical protein